MNKEKILKQMALILPAAFSCFLWATAIPTLKISYKLLNIPADDIFNRFVLAGIRFLLAGVLIGVYILIKEKKIRVLKGSQWKTVLIFGLLNTSLQYMFFYTGVGNTGAIKGVLIDTSKPLIVVILAHLLTQDDKININKIMGLIIGFVGIILANIEGAVGGGLNLDVSLMGEGSLILASLAYGFAVLYGKRAMQTMSSVMLNMYQMVFGSIILLGIGLVGAGGFNLVFNMQALLLLIYSAFLSAIAFVVWYGLIHKYNASSVTIYIFLIPIFGSIISSIIFPEESLSVFVVISLILMTISINLVNRNGQTKKGRMTYHEIKENSAS